MSDEAKKQRILLIDDSATVRAAISFILKPLNLVIDEVTDAEEALMILNPSHRLVLADYYLPGRSGLEFCVQIRAEEAYRDLPILLMSTDFSDSLKDEARKAGASAWLQKPFSPDSLIELVKEMV